MSTYKPATRQELIDFCLRQLGAPVLEINLDEDQAQDCFEIALQFFRDNHYDGTEAVFLAERIIPSTMNIQSGNANVIQIGETITGDLSNATAIVHLIDSANVIKIKNVTGNFQANEGFTTNQTSTTGNLATTNSVVLGNFDNKYISIDDSVISVERIIPFSNRSSAINMFDVQYQLMLNNIWSLTMIDVAYYAQLKSYLNMINDLFGETKPIRYNRHTDRLYIDTSWGTQIKINDFIIVEAYKALDPDQYTQVYNDPFLKEYLTALLKRQWGINMKKFQGMQLPGGVIMDGQTIYNEAVAKLQQLEDEVQSKYQEPVDFFMG